MLQELRQHSRSFIIWILFGIIIVVFVISFGPQANAQLGCGASDLYAMKVNGREIDQHSWRFAMNGMPFMLNIARMPKPQRAELAMDLLLQRELLAQAAEDTGFRISTELVNEKIKRGEWYLMGYRADGRGWFFTDGVFDYDRLESASRSLGLPTVDHFLEQQRRELLADAMRGLLMGSVQISREELLASFNHQHTLATVDYVKYRPAEYKRALTLTDAEVATYLAGHEDDVKAKYDAEEATYKDVKPQARVRQIFLERTAEPPEPPTEDAPADDAAKKDAANKDAANKAKPAEKTPDPKMKKAEAARKKLAGGADFAKLAAKLSDDERSAKSGGDLGWRTVSAPGLGHAKLSEALAALKQGEISDVIETPRGYYILKVDELREGDLSFEQVKLEIARDLAREHYAREGARRDAEAAMAQVKSGKPLEELFEREETPAYPPPGDIDIEKLRQQLPPGTDIEELLEQIRNQRGSIVIESDNIPAQANAETKKAAKPAPGAPSARRKAPAKEEKIPRPEGLETPKLRTVGPFMRETTGIPGVGESAELVRAVFDELENGQLADRVFEVSDGFVILQLVAREEPDLDEFEKTEKDLRLSYLGGKGFDALREWVLQRCHQAVSERQVVVNKGFLSYHDDDGKPLPITYQPCGNL